MSRKLLVLLLGALALGTAAAPAGAATVTLQIEGRPATLGPVTVTTPATVTRGAGTCSGSTALGALDAATSGNWDGPFFGAGSFGPATFSLDTILGETHTFGSGAYWSVYVNGRYQNTGVCQVEVVDGDAVLFFDSDDTFVPGLGGYEEPLTLTAPAAVKPGEPFTIAVRETTTTFDGAGAGTSTLAPSAGATVTAGTVAATTGVDGVATLTVPTAGPFAVKVTKGDRAPARTTLCATTGSDGVCNSPVPAPAAPCVTSGDDGRCGSPDKKASYGFVTSIDEGQAFAKGRGPRQLAGRVDPDPSGIAQVRVRLTRRDHGDCATFNATRQRFVAMKACGATNGSFFTAGTTTDWSYLLPSRMAEGRYVLDVVVVDKAGNRDDQLARGRNRVVFTVA